MNIEFDGRREENPTVIRVIGVGGGGCNAVNRMIASDIDNIQFVVANTDSQDLFKSNSYEKIQLGQNLTKGLGAGADPIIGKKAAEEAHERITEVLKDADMVFVTAGMGGGTGTGAAPVISSIAKKMGILTVAIVTKPFHFEAKRRMDKANAGIEELIQNVDTLIVIPNQNLLKIADRKTSLNESFILADDVLRQAVQGISELITKTGDINVDFADVKKVMSQKGKALMGIGQASGDERAAKAARMAINNPILDNDSVEGADALLINITASNDLSLDEYREVSEIIQERVADDSEIIIGFVRDDKMEDEMKVTVIATGFNKLDNAFDDDSLSENSLVPRDELTKSPFHDGKIEELAVVHNMSSFPSYFSDDDLDTPAFIRMRERKRNKIYSEN